MWGLEDKCWMRRMSFTVTGVEKPPKKERKMNLHVSWFGKRVTSCAHISLRDTRTVLVQSPLAVMNSALETALHYTHILYAVCTHTHTHAHNELHLNLDESMFAWSVSRANPKLLCGKHAVQSLTESRLAGQPSPTPSHTHTHTHTPQTGLLVCLSVCENIKSWDWDKHTGLCLDSAYFISLYMGEWPITHQTSRSCV